jgi:hypothetical protein
MKVKRYFDQILVIVFMASRSLENTPRPAPLPGSKLTQTPPDRPGAP